MPKILYKITSISDYNEIKIFINKHLHFSYKKEAHIGIKSYTDGSINKSYWIDVLNEKGTISLSYTDINIWFSVLKELEKI